jgi:hypothetical protein
MFDGRFPCQQAHKLGERSLRFWSLCQHYPCSGHTSVVLGLSVGAYEIHVMLHAGFMKSDSPPARMRLPQGFSHLRPELGEILRDHRTYVKGTVGRSVRKHLPSV